jgi:hypothetical protein
MKNILVEKFSKQKLVMLCLEEILHNLSRKMFVFRKKGDEQPWYQFPVITISLGSFMVGLYRMNCLFFAVLLVRNDLVHIVSVI